MGSRKLALWLAFAVPFVAYLLTTGGTSYWLDTGEFVAMTERLDIAHPPGHPLSQLYGKAFTLLPFGSITFRVALGQAVATALSSLFLCLSVHAVVRALALDERMAWAVAVFGAWLSALTYGLWFQAVRAEVYALQTLCMSVVFAYATRLQAQRTLEDARPLYGAAFALGLGLANHHLIALFVAPALLPATVRVLVARGLRPLALACGFGLLGLCAYVYLPVRAAVPPAVNLGNPSTLDNFAWVVSARVYSQNLHLLHMEPVSQRFWEVAIIALESFHVVFVMAALVGLYLGLRHPATRRPVLFLGLVLSVCAGVRAWMGSVRANPDILGYLSPAFLALGALAAMFAAALVSVLCQRFPDLARRGARYAWLLALPALSIVPSSVSRASLAGFDATDTFDERRIRSLPARSVVIASTPQTAFRAWELDAVDAVRPDIVYVPLSFLRYPGTADLLAARQPAVAPLISGYFERDALRPHDLLVLAKTRPVFVELDTHYPTDAYRILAPAGLLHRVLESPSLVPTPGQLERERDELFRSVYAAIGGNLHEVETARQLLWIHYMDTLYFASLGGRKLARASLARALSLHPADARLHKIATALYGSRDEGPLSVAPYLDF